jgi:hypothetical protein
MCREISHRFSSRSSSRQNASIFPKGKADILLFDVLLSDGGTHCQEAYQRFLCLLKRAYSRDQAIAGMATLFSFLSKLGRWQAKCAQETDHTNSHGE